MARAEETTPRIRREPLSIVDAENRQIDDQQSSDAHPAIRREQFIPLRRSELESLLLRGGKLSPTEQDQFGRFCRLLAATIHHEHHGEIEQLKNLYAPFDPDADTLSRDATTAGSDELDELFRRFDGLLERANFRRLTQADLEFALAACSEWGLSLRVNFDLFERLELYARGSLVGFRSKRRWKSLWRLERVPLPVYQRLVVIFRLRGDCRFGRELDTRDVFIKIFKDIPQMDLEMLLPGTQVRMSLLDQTKIFLPTLSGVAITAWKIVKGALLAAAVGFSGLLVLLGLVGGTIGYGIRSLHGYLRTKQKYQLSLTESLYYQNLDNNAGVFFRLLDEAEEQEGREALLAYYFLWRRGKSDSVTAEQLDGDVEALLCAETGREIDFEVSDALAKLQRWQLVETKPDGSLIAVGLEEAIARLDARWDGYFSATVSPRSRGAAG
jgi:hypothetical protein